MYFRDDRIQCRADDYLYPLLLSDLSQDSGVMGAGLADTAVCGGSGTDFQGGFPAVPLSCGSGGGAVSGIVFRASGLYHRKGKPGECVGQ